MSELLAAANSQSGTTVKRCNIVARDALIQETIEERSLYIKSKHTIDASKNHINIATSQKTQINPHKIPCFIHYT